MKKRKIGLLCLMVIIAILLSSCNVSKDIYEVQLQDGLFIVDSVNMTITNNDDIYKYALSGSQITITYPDNSYCWMVIGDGGGYGGFSDDYDETKYISGNTLIHVLSSEVPKENNTNYFIILILFILGIWNTTSPYSAWYLSYGWRYKNAEPSEFAIAFTRISGIIIIILSIILIFTNN